MEDVDVRRSTRTRMALQDHVETTEQNQIVLRSRNLVNSNNTMVPNATSRLHAGAISATVGDRRHSITPLFSSYITPSPSPDELVIQQRGRKSLPLVWSPDIDKNKMLRSSARKTPTTPLSRQSTPNPAGVDGAAGTTVLSSQLRPSSCILASKLRRTPRKRLLLDDSIDGGGANGSDTPTSSSGGLAARRESIRRTRLQMKNRRSRAAGERTLSTSSSTSNLSILSGSNDVSSTTVGDRLNSSLQYSARSDTVDSTTSDVVLSMRTRRSLCVIPSEASRVLPNGNDVGSEVISVDSSRSCSTGSESSRSFSIGSESSSRSLSSGSESGGEKLKAHREDLKDQLCSLDTDQLRELLRDVLERNPLLMDEFGMGGVGKN
uniref:Uncharacterized protein n=1 Tax=Cacopsylla melanoneura TaxID=428564 RepID=A0A8D9AHK5_9HEMI